MATYDKPCKFVNTSFQRTIPSVPCVNDARHASSLLNRKYQGEGRSVMLGSSNGSTLKAYCDLRVVWPGRRSLSFQNRTFLQEWINVLADYETVLAWQNSRSLVAPAMTR